MLDQLRPSLCVDLYCYGFFAMFRVLVPDVGGVYRDYLEDELAEAVDAWTRDLVALAEQKIIDLRTVWGRGMEAFIRERFPSTRTPQRKRDLTIWLVREMNSQRFRAEAQKIIRNPDLLAFRILRNRPVPADVDTIIEQAGLEGVARTVPPAAWLDERAQPVLDTVTAKILHLADALRDMRTPNGSFPWQTTRQMWNEADERAREKVDWQQDKFDTHEKPWGDMVQVGVRLTEGRDDAEQIQARLDGQKRYDAVAAEIRRSFRAQRTTHYLRLWRLYWENMGDLPQTEATARRAQVSLSTVKRFFADARRREWIKS